MCVSCYEVWWDIYEFYISCSTSFIYISISENSSIFNSGRFLNEAFLAILTFGPYIANQSFGGNRKKLVISVLKSTFLEIFRPRPGRCSWMRSRTTRTASWTVASTCSFEISCTPNESFELSKMYKYMVKKLKPSPLCVCLRFFCISNRENILFQNPSQRAIGCQWVCPSLC